VLPYRNSKLKKEGKERRFVGTIIHACLAGQASVTQVNLTICFPRLEPRDRTMTIGIRRFGRDGSAKPYAVSRIDN
jgi:hypothetical protein